MPAFFRAIVKACRSSAILQTGIIKDPGRRIVITTAFDYRYQFIGVNVHSLFLPDNICYTFAGLLSGNRTPGYKSAADNESFSIPGASWIATGTTVGAGQLRQHGINARISGNGKSSGGISQAGT
jgi:hypothetical protein